MDLTIKTARGFFLESETFHVLGIHFIKFNRFDKKNRPMYLFITKQIT